MSTKTKVLYVDDNPVMVDTFALKLEQHNMEVRAVVNVDDALKILHEGYAPDVILFDIDMPIKNGYDFLAELRTQQMAPTAIKVALSNWSKDTDMEKAKALGATAYIIKSTMTANEVSQKLEALLAAR